MLYLVMMQKISLFHCVAVLVFIYNCFCKGNSLFIVVIFFPLSKISIIDRPNGILVSYKCLGNVHELAKAGRDTTSINVEPFLVRVYLTESMKAPVVNTLYDVHVIAENFIQCQSKQVAGAAQQFMGRIIRELFIIRLIKKINIAYSLQGVSRDIVIVKTFMSITPIEEVNFVSIVHF